MQYYAEISIIVASVGDFDDRNILKDDESLCIRGLKLIFILCFKFFKHFIILILLLYTLHVHYILHKTLNNIFKKYDHIFLSP